jgi:hypothetical protein
MVTDKDVLMPPSLFWRLSIVFVNLLARLNLLQYLPGFLNREGLANNPFCNLDISLWKDLAP